MQMQILKSVISERQDNTPLLFAVIEYPRSVDGYKYFDQYYSAMRDAVTYWLREVELPRIKAEFSSMTEHDRKFRFPRYDYKLKCRANSDDITTHVTCEFEYSRGGTDIKHSTLYRLWDNRDGYMIKKRKHT